MDDPKNPSQKLMEKIKLLDNFPLSAYGETSDTKEILRYLISRVLDYTELLLEFHYYQLGNKYLSPARDMIISNTLPFSLYTGANSVNTSNTNLNNLVFMIATHCAKVLEEPIIDINVASGMDAVTSRSNDVITTQVAGEALELIVEYIRDRVSHFKLIFKILMVVLITLVLVIFIIIYRVQIIKLKNNKEELYGIFLQLPKTVISNISSSFNKTNDGSTKTNKSNIELNRQEDGIIKLFSSISDGTTSGNIEIYNVFNLLVVLACEIIGNALIFSHYIKGAESLVKNCHHIDYLYGSICIMFSVFSSLLTVVPAEYDPSLSPMSPRPDVEMGVIKDFIPKIIQYVHLLRFGGSDKDDVPYIGMEEAIDVGTTLLLPTTKIIAPTNIQDSVHEFSSEQQIYLTIAYLKRILNNFYQQIYPKLNGEVDVLWQIGPFELYQALYYNEGEKIVPKIRKEIDIQHFKIIAITILTSVIGLIFTLISLKMISKEEDTLKFALNNLMRCDSSIIFQNHKIVELLSGNYNTSKHEDTSKSIRFHSDVVNKLIDIIIVAQEMNNEIIGVNKSFEEMFNLAEDEIVGTKIEEFFLNGRFKSDDKIEKVLNNKTELVYTDKNDNKHIIEFSIQCVAGKKIFSGTDITQTILHEKMIADEKKRSDAMLASILPPSLVPRVQAEEKNISFSIKSVTVLFLDVVEFTPWCGSQDAQYVMRMLNIMFKEYDMLTNAHKTMTKIKCIGDCYMAAGGIFDEVNQPAVHAKEVVDFGCCLIKKLIEIDERENEKLRIRVGINTGGPIIAGVIGTEKPTFEILGPAINIAHEMESKGVPMKVHISRPVYELIYGQHFSIKERGEIDIKGGKMFTYLVDP
ncbi:Adenylate and Guanylate cyclase catalytic domain containing protein [Trichomonas vaginalis G3]|uniref:Adenylate and Guanylate cyclase catalytic domain containing protein n=1 Tax=Trichomonas vaginalis (strain ATCC PRA-98 / G3) TaxID=412133 RepID=A2FHK9_TRIV3|nr:guanylate cyclase protein [Trichomonas vaginalis G3]EAX95600.1 Adenylate and Guanylate cyclase catalytic domain containing protein [Trichomonas vaginalis G3]KAI5511922.1 guanylate cyclase protein [Trichomonas vaginalis G3]|eukprot:XP_001308530.1 Adenylate and Guanylate cyclase catalytic domain containing protein [Trichomonas vaginalis G3]